eukprot:5540870-Prymnesium_polylepis.1
MSARRRAVSALSRLNPYFPSDPLIGSVADRRSAVARAYIVRVPLGRSATEPITGGLGNCGLSMAGLRGHVEFRLDPLSLDIIFGKNVGDDRKGKMLRMPEGHPTMGVRMPEGHPTMGAPSGTPPWGPFGHVESNEGGVQDLGRSSMASIYYSLTFSLRHLRGFDRS